MITEDLLQSLVCAKYLYVNATEVMKKNGPFADGIAILSFQDSAEPRDCGSGFQWRSTVALLSFDGLW
jgi:hypothetical protein